MGTCRTINCERSRDEGVKSAGNVGSTSAADLPDENPDATHKGEFIVAILEEHTSAVERARAQY
jgi:hypothetical protein